ncbi:MAG: hypothetical protein GEEBNDBF_00641 [bacterium]|nr:hypothetical protein [bacterium]
MSLSNRDRVGQVMDLLKAGVEPYVRRRLDAELGANWAAGYAGATAAPRPLVAAGRRPTGAEAVAAGRAREALDILALLKAMRDNWNASFAPELGQILRSVCHELIEWRHQWAHQSDFSTEDTLRVMDNAKRLLEAISAGDQSMAIEQQRRELLSLQVKEQGRAEFRKVQMDLIATESVPDKLEGWRQVITPRQDVREGSFELAGYAADLWEVYKGAATKEYGDPIEFFARTYLTNGLRELLVQAVKRLTKQGGAPVIQLQTNFGGGKTHSMLALWHLTSGVDAARLPGVETALLEPLGQKAFPTVRRAVFVGTKRGPAEIVTPEKGVEIHTLWGELAYQLLGKKGYGLVAESDKAGVNPGGGLKALLEQAAPCLIMIDEWVAYARQLADEPGLPAGTLGAQLTFAQSLTEAASNTPGVLLVVSVPESDMEVGGPAGANVLEKLRHHIGRVETSWRPADRAESFEIVRRRLFEDLPSEQVRKRDAVCMAFSESYRKQVGDFPANCRDKAYEDELKLAYPIHPEVFTRLYEDWSTGIEKFQRTRGVLRLMAIVVHHLWEGGDSHLMIMPGTIPMDIDAVQNELTRYLEENWRPVIDQEIAGPGSRAQQLDLSHPQFAKVGAARKIARTVFLGSAPLQKTANRGIEDLRIKLGSVQPGENPATYGDALRRLSDAGVYLYSSANKYWYGLQATINRLAVERAERYGRDEEAISQELSNRVKLLFKNRGKWPKISVCPRDPSEVGDDAEARLVVLSPEEWYDPKQAEQSPALASAKKILEERAGGPRRHKNVLFFQVPLKAHLEKLNEKAATYLAWHSIDGDIASGNLEVDGQQKKQAKDKLHEADATLLASLPELYAHVLYPSMKKEPGSPVVWEGQKLSLSRDGDPAVESFRKLEQVSVLIDNLGATVLRMEMDRIPLWERNLDHVEIRKLGDLFPVYLYLPKLSTPGVLERCIATGLEGLQINPETFAYAESYDDERGRYVGLVEGRLPYLTLDGAGLLVKASVARAQLDAERAAADAAARAALPAGEMDIGVGKTDGPVPAGDTPPRPTMNEPVAPALPTRFHGSVLLDPTRVGREAGKIADEVITHLEKLIGAKVEVRLEIQATLPEGYPEDVQRTVSENSRTLKFTGFGFEKF